MPIGKSVKQVSEFDILQSRLFVKYGNVDTLYYEINLPTDELNNLFYKLNEQLKEIEKRDEVIRDLLRHIEHNGSHAYYYSIKERCKSLGVIKKSIKTEKLNIKGDSDG